MKASEIFDSCHGRYRNLREWLAESTEQIRALDPESNYDCYHWRPAQVRAAEFVADYERIGHKALGRPEWKGRLKLFEIYLCIRWSTSVQFRWRASGKARLNTGLTK